jgi:hypothetical protein
MTRSSKHDRARHHPRFTATAFLLTLLGLLFGACHRPAEVIDACAQNKDLCLPCKSDADCHFTGNPCLSTVHCAHKDALIAVAELGCSEEIEYSWPDDDECVCDTTCRSAAAR